MKKIISLAGLVSSLAVSCGVAEEVDPLNYHSGANGGYSVDSTGGSDGMGQAGSTAGSGENAGGYGGYETVGSGGSGGQGGLGGNDRECGPCQDKITAMILQFNGLEISAVTAKDWKGNQFYHNAAISPSEQLVLNTDIMNGTLGPKVELYVNGLLNTEIHTSCSDPNVLPGYSAGLFTLVAGESKIGGPLCDYQ